MSRNGSGTYTPPSNSWYPPVDGEEATPADWLDTIGDLASALTQSVATNGVSQITANIPMGGYKFTGLAAGSNPNDSVRYEQLEAVSDELSVQSFFLAYMSADKTDIPDNTLTGLPINTESYDVGSYFDTSTYRWTPPAGKVLMGFSTFLTTGVVSGSIAAATLRKNGSVWGIGAARNSGANGVAPTAGNNVTGTACDLASGTDYYDVAAIVDTAGGNATAEAEYTFFWGIVLK